MRQNTIFTCKGHTFILTYFTDDTPLEKFKNWNIIYLIQAAYEPVIAASVEDCEFIFNECYEGLRIKFNQIITSNENLYQYFTTKLIYGDKTIEYDESGVNVRSFRCGVNFEKI